MNIPLIPNCDKLFFWGTVDSMCFNFFPASSSNSNKPWICVFPSNYTVCVCYRDIRKFSQYGTCYVVRFFFYFAQKLTQEWGVKQGQMIFCGNQITSVSKWRSGCKMGRETERGESNKGEIFLGKLFNSEMEVLCAKLYLYLRECPSRRHSLGDMLSLVKWN